MFYTPPKILVRVDIFVFLAPAHTLQSSFVQKKKTRFNQGGKSFKLIYEYHNP